tara:strand:- start:75 stop:401 length:327 start_codon:yes stop_codon:yes gene_type:complete
MLRSPYRGLPDRAGNKPITLGKFNIIHNLPLSKNCRPDCGHSQNNEIIFRRGIRIMTDSAKRDMHAKVISTLEEILVELDNLQLSLPALKVVEALEILSGKMEESLTE